LGRERSKIGLFERRFWGISLSIQLLPWFVSFQTLVGSFRIVANRLVHSLAGGP
jgi:hypothetical protein